MKCRLNLLMDSCLLRSMAPVSLASRTDDDIKCRLYLLMDSCSLRAMAPVSLASSSPLSAFKSSHRTDDDVKCRLYLLMDSELPPLVSRSSYRADDDIKCRLYLLMDSCSLRAVAPVSLASSSGPAQVFR
jgi:hypothetical protein